MDRVHGLQDVRQETLSSDFGTHKTVKAKFWFWIAGTSPKNHLKVFSLRSEAVRASGPAPRLQGNLTHTKHHSLLGPP